MTSYVDDNPYPKVLLVSGSAPSAPASGKVALYLDSGDGHLKHKDSSSTVVDLEGGATGTFSGEVTGTDFKATGLTGAASAVRLVGGNASGAPASGTFAVRDVAVDSAGALWVCTSAGSPGTWVQVGGGGAGAMTKITETIVAGSPVANVNLTSISGSYRHLLLTYALAGSSASTNIDMRMQLNADTGANYSWQRINWFGGSGSSFSSEGVSDTSFLPAYVTDSTAPANNAGTGAIWLYDYARTAWNKQYRCDYAFQTANSTTNQYTGASMGRWANTAAITSIKLFMSSGNIVVGSVLTLWGLV